MIVHVNTVECVGFQVGGVVDGFMDQSLYHRVLVSVWLAFDKDVFHHQPFLFLPQPPFHFIIFSTLFFTPFFSFLSLQKLTHSLFFH